MSLKSASSYDTLFLRSLSDPEGFWSDAAKDISWFKPWTRCWTTATRPSTAGSPAGN
ncbi:acetyl-coenzyme A synthetase N-terminal domain-containing protein [Azospirillum oryzae]|uniref:acetyl-coenzyme A synthetase N-terminal domain-containing protein n=1 Tax=Azospirillum oryzae TaxID=286727 RepID=UPI0032AFE9FF